MSRIEIHCLEALLRQELAAASPAQSERLLEECERLATQLEGEERVDGKPHALAIRAMSAVLLGAREDGLALLSQAVSEYERAGLEMHAWCLLRRQGELLRDAEQVEEADAWLRAHGIREPQAWVRLFVPDVSGRR